MFAKSIDRSEVLASRYLESLRVADEIGARTIAFTAISGGLYRWPLDSAARIAVQTVRVATTAVREVTFVLYDDAAYEAFRRVRNNYGIGESERPACGNRNSTHC